MYLQYEVDAVIEKLKDSAPLKDCLIIKSYPYAKKPSPLKKSVITVSPAGIKAEQGSLGQDRLLGEYTIDADAFVPQSFGSPAASELIDAVFEAVRVLMPSRVEISRIKAEDALNCFSAKCSFTFLV